ncbi:YMGG-like glycine zipper-containing protein [Mucilaginibacter sp.]|uniref:YMGG-like glycine zipper-containing protein n=1 Tax=Mucilaginibacter sp. TaxID=1882438 RepID=UPI003AFFABF4
MKNLILIFAVFFTLSATAPLVQAQTTKRTSYKNGHKYVTKTKTRHGMSKRAKGAIIGGGAGALGGAIIGHGVKGALLGGALGAGAGYVVGNETDKGKSRAGTHTVTKRKTVY